MMRRTLLLLATLVMGVLFTACSLVSTEKSFAPSHPEALGAGRPTCSDCHGTEKLAGGFKSYASFDHTAAFVKDHRFQANQSFTTCASCHAQAFCSDCHGGKTPTRPSVKMGDRPDRVLPHRGDYLTLHRIDGKLDPTGCYRCHGRANNDKCMACHR
jgi:hypothetical protein